MNPLSIFSFKTLRDWRKIPWAGVLCLCFIAIVTLALKLTAVEDYLPPPYFPRHQISIKSMALKANIEYGVNPEIFFIGSSVADMGFDAMTFERYINLRGWHLHTFNFGINGAGPTVFYNLVKDVLIPKSEVKYLYYGLSLIEFNSNSKSFRSDQDEIMDSPYYAMERGGFIPSAWLKRFLFKKIEIFRIKDAFWSNIFTEEETWLKFRLHGLKYLMFNGQHRAAPPMPSWAITRGLRLKQKRIDRLKDLMGDYSTKGSNLKKIQDLIRLCREHDIKLILVSMPVITDPMSIGNNVYMNMIRPGDNGVIPMEAFEKAFKKICSENEVPCLNLGGHTLLTSDDFYDPIHLYSTGARKLAVPLAEYFLRNQ